MTEIEKKDKPGIIIDRMIMVLGVLMVIFHLINAKSYVMMSVQFRNGHLAFAMMMVYLGAARKSEKNWSRYCLAAIAFIILLCALRIHVDYQGIMDRAWVNTRLDLVVGICMIILCLISVKFSIGWFMLILISAICIYPFFGQYLPEPFTTKAYPIMLSIANFGLSLTTGIYGNNLMTSAEYVFLFVIFGSLLSATGVQKFFWELGKLLFRKLPSGPGLMAVLNSALVGSVTGSAIANVMITGVYTIPAMKKAGYKAEVAGALEAAASSGGQIMPPVMGIVAFIMASYTGIPYIKIVAMAILPALLYYLGVALYAHFVTMKRNYETKSVQELDFFSEKVDYRTFYWKMPGFIIPLLLIVVMLAGDMAVMETAFWAIISLIVISQLVPKDLRPPIKDLIHGMVDGAKEGSGLGVVICACGLILVTFTGSGLAVKLASSITIFSGGTMIGVLLIVWAMSILFGMIGVASVAYYMSAAFAASVLIKAGLPVESTHFFLMFPCIFSVITPPVALACVVAAKLAEANYIKCSYETVRAAFTALLLPFLVVYAPAIILQRSPATPVFWLEISLCILFVVSGEFMFIGYMALPISWPERCLLAVAFAGSFLYLAIRLPLILLLTTAAFALFLVNHILRYKKKRKDMIVSAG